MKACNKVIHHLRLTLIREWTSSVVYLSLFFVFAIVVQIYGGYGPHLIEKGEVINLWEPYIWYTASRVPQITFLMLSMCMGYQAISKMHSGSNVLVRMDRTSWVMGRILHLVVMVFICNLFLLMGIWICCRWQITAEDQWSKSFIRMAQLGAGVEDVHPMINTVSYSFHSHSPWTVGGYAFLLNLLGGVFTGLFVMACSLAGGAIFGGLGIGALWYLQIFTNNPSLLSGLITVSPYDLCRVIHTSLGYGEKSPWYSVMMLLAYCMICAVSIFHCSEKASLAE